VLFQIFTGINKPYKTIVDFFFNKTVFTEKLIDKQSPYGSPTNVEYVDKNNLHNIMVMLKALFHINENIIEQPIHNSYENKYGSIEKNNGLGEILQFCSTHY
jgi:hypothetical protein